MELLRQRLSGELLDPRRGFAPTAAELEVRWDPLTGQSARLVRGPGPLLPPSDLDLQEVGERFAESCPFCAARIEQMTPRLSPRVWPDGRIRHGEAVLFPNLLAYAAHSSVSVYSPDIHYLPLGEMTPRLVADNLATQVAFDRAVLRSDPKAVWASINANHMLPSGGSLFHPHLQGSVDPVPTTMQRLLADVPAERFDEYLLAERDAGERHLGNTGRVEWLASFAPIAPAELRAFVPGLCSPAELEDSLVEELGYGIATALGLYAELGFESFNMAIYGAPPGTDGYPLNLRLGCRSNLEPLYRSDAMYLERLHWESAVDVIPEELAERAGDRFRTTIRRDE
jgi:UDPglucose--hexose-1-phosphate uridylyltransferase